MTTCDDKYICDPPSFGPDGQVRYVLKPNLPGTKPLFVIGLNPTFANEKILDSTVKNVEKFAKNYEERNHFVMFNLCPQRTPDKKRLLKMFNDGLLNVNDVSLDANIKKIGEELEGVEKPTIFACWGSILNTPPRLKCHPYFKKSLSLLFKIPEVRRATWIRIKTKDDIHYPMHPTRQNENLKRFAEGLILEEWESGAVKEYMKEYAGFDI